MRPTNLVTDSELAEVTVVLQPSKTSNPFNSPNHDPACTHKHLLLRFAFLQRIAKDKVIPFFHVMNEGRHHHSTLSIDGLKEWELI